MAKREPKSVQETSIDVRGADAKQRGRLVISSGNLTYYRKSAKSETARFTLQQVIDLIESNLALEELIKVKGVWPTRKTGNDFYLRVENKEGVQIFESTQRREDFDLQEYYAGSYVIDSGNCMRTPRNGFSWAAFVSIFACISFLDDYINDVMKGKRRKNFKDKEHPISKEELQALLAQWQKDIS